VRPQWRRAGPARPGLDQHQQPHPADCRPGGSGRPPILSEKVNRLYEGRRTQPAQSVLIDSEWAAGLSDLSVPEAEEARDIRPYLLVNITTSGQQ